jgi:hypothetical protein
VLLQTSLGCDSTVNLNLTVHPNKTVNLSQSICDGDSATAGGRYFYTEGIHTVVIPTSLGCDSTIILDLAVNELPLTGTLFYRSDSILVAGSTGAQYNWYLDGVFQTSTSIPGILPTAQGSWTVVVVSNEGCLSGVSEPWVITGIRNNRSDVYFNILPNPAQGQFELQISVNTPEKYILTVYNLTGQVMMLEYLFMQPGLNLKRYSVDGWSPGMYFISLAGNEQVSTKNLVIQ